MRERASRRGDRERESSAKKTHRNKKVRGNSNRIFIMRAGRPAVSRYIAYAHERRTREQDECVSNDTRTAI